MTEHHYKERTIAGEGRIIKERSSDEQSQVESLETSLRLLAGGTPTKVQDAQSTEDRDVSEPDTSSKPYALPSNVINPDGLPLVKFTRNLLLKKRLRKQSIPAEKAA